MAVTVSAAGETVRVDYVLPSARFQFGVTVGANDTRMPGGNPTSLAFSYNRVRPALGRDLGQRVKFFGDQGVDDAVNMWHSSPGREPVPLLTSEVWDPPALDRLMTVLTAPVDFCFHQEFMDKLGAAFTVAQFNSWYAQLRTQVDAHPNGHLVQLRMVGNEAVERTASSPVWRQIVVPPRCGIGNDTYVSQTKHLDPAAAFKASVDWFNARKVDTPGVRLMISESGVSRTNFSPAQRITALRGYATYLASVGASSYNYWATDNSGKSPEKDWSFDKPGDESVAAAVAALIST